MAVFESEDRVRQRRHKSEQAISLAMKNRWDEAAQVNREILELFPNDVEAHNRLGKALTELGRYAEARDAYARAVKADPANTIAAKNLQRLTQLAEEGGPAAAAPTPVDPRLFIEESGKTTVTVLTDARRGDAVVKLSAGDQLRFQQRDKEMVLLDHADEVVGRIEPRLEQELIRLLAMGNRYSATVTALSEQTVHVIIREVARASSMGNRPSFRPLPRTVRAETRDRALRYDIEDEDDEDAADEEEQEPDPDAPAPEADVEVTPLQTIAAAEEEKAEETT